MPTNLKKLVRSRMDKTGESYATALRYVRRRGERRLQVRRGETRKVLAPPPAEGPAARRWHYRGTMPRDPRIDAYVRSVPGPLGGIVSDLVDLVRRAVPGHDEVLTHGAPQFCIEGEPVCYVVGYAKHVNLGFCDGASLQDPSGLLEGSGKAMRHVKLRPGKALPVESLAQLVRGAARRVRAKQAADARGAKGVRDARR